MILGKLAAKITVIMLIKAAKNNQFIGQKKKNHILQHFLPDRYFRNLA